MNVDNRAGKQIDDIEKKIDDIKEIFFPDDPIINFYLKEYNRTKNPVFMLLILSETAHAEKTFPPVDVVKWMSKGFLEYFSSNGEKSLDEIFLFKSGKKKNPVNKYFDDYSANFDGFLVEVFHIVKAFGGISTEKAVAALFDSGFYSEEELKYTEETFLKKCKTSVFF